MCVCFSVTYSMWSLCRLYNVSESVSEFYRPDETDDVPFICSTTRDNGMLHCSDIPKRRVGGADCELMADNVTDLVFKGPPHHGCVNWNLYYNNCNASEHNPHNGAINFDNIGYAWIAIFQVCTRVGKKMKGYWMSLCKLCKKKTKKTCIVINYF